ncbi:MAG: prepilin-type N-terminal cleavage/methylation domain-containing protein [Campylobacterales bacterium]|nr:prepilin-type N-terminal cleavage/methylation domain-containing protein [Campylobacterales bacterium]
MKKAFTMIELVFVIVVMGIIAAVALPRFESDNVQEAMDQILSDIRYTQHLALVDNVIDPTNASWQSALWTIRFQKTTVGDEFTYTIASDISNYDGNFDKIEAAIDPRDGRPIYGNIPAGDTTVSPKVFITKKFGITNVDFATGCNVATGSGGTNNSQHIGFDSFGRPHKGHLGNNLPNYSSIMQGNCTIAFTFAGGETSWVTIQRETGYACISNNAGVCRQD